MPEQELALAVIDDAIRCQHREFLLCQGDYEEIARFWYALAELEPLGEQQLLRVLKTAKADFDRRLRERLQKRK